MTRFATLCAALIAAAPAAAQDHLQPGSSFGIQETAPAIVTPNSDPEDFDLAKKKVVDCEGEKFVFAWGAGARPTKVTLCSKENATPQELVKMLDDAATKLEQTAIPEDRRTAIVQQIRAKISELKGASAAAPAATGEPSAAVAQRPLTPPQPAVRSTLVPAVSTAAAAVRTPVLAPKPRLSFDCYTPGEIGTGGPCVVLGRDTRLTVKAGEPLTVATTLRFIRNGENRGEIALAQLRKGQSARLTLPRSVCAGVVEAETNIHIVRGGQVVDSIGPYLLRC